MAKASKGAKAPTKGKEVVVEIQPLNIRPLMIRLVGDGPLVVHNWSEKAKKEMRDKQMGKAKRKKRPKSPPECFIDSLHWISRKPARKDDKNGHSTWTMEAAIKAVEKGKFGFPAVGLKAAFVDACSHVGGVTKVLARGTIHIDADLIEIVAPPPQMREDMVRVGMGTADIRYRAEFRDWSATAPVRYNASVLTVEQIVNLFNTAGFAIGIGEGRPQKRDMGWGRFHVATAGE